MAEQRTWGKAELSSKRSAIVSPLSYSYFSSFISQTLISKRSIWLGFYLPELWGEKKPPHNFCLFLLRTTHFNISVLKKLWSWLDLLYIRLISLTSLKLFLIYMGLGLLLFQQLQTFATVEVKQGWNLCISQKQCKFCTVPQGKTDSLSFKVMRPVGLPKCTFSLLIVHELIMNFLTLKFIRH